MNREGQSPDPRLRRLRKILRVRAERGASGNGEGSCDRLEAAVSLVLRPREEVELLLIKRARSDRDPWSGHMALPGGRREECDPSLIATATRETGEETGVALERIGTRMGRLPNVAPMSRSLPRLRITPYVFGVPGDTAARPEPREVEAVFWVPLSHFLDPVQRREVLFDLRGVPRPFRAIQVGTEVVWGLTRRILDDFLPVIRDFYAEPGDPCDGAPAPPGRR